MVKQAITGALGANAINSGDLVVVTAGVPSGSTGTTNMIRVHIAGKVLLSGNGILRKSATGRVFIAANLPIWRYSRSRDYGTRVDEYC